MANPNRAGKTYPKGVTYAMPSEQVAINKALSDTRVSQKDYPQLVEKTGSGSGQYYPTAPAISQPILITKSESLGGGTSKLFLSEAQRVATPTGNLDLGNIPVKEKEKSWAEGFQNIWTGIKSEFDPNSERNILNREAHQKGWEKTLPQRNITWGGAVKESVIQVAPAFAPWASGVWGSTPKIIKTGADVALQGANVFFTTKQVSNLFNPNLEYSQRIASGVFAGFGSISIVSSAYKGVNYLAGYPKTNTQILGVTQTQTGNKVITDIAFKTNVKNLIGSKTYFGVAKGTSKILGGDLQIGKTFTGGIYATKGYSFPTGKIKFGEVTPFASGGVSLSKDAEVLFVRNVPFKVNEITGNVQGSVGVIATKKGGNYFGGVGGSYGTSKVTKIFGEVGLFKQEKLVRGTAGTYSGVFLKAKDTTSSVNSILSGGAKSSQQYLNNMFSVPAVTEVTKQSASAFALQQSTKASTITSNILSGTGAVMGMNKPTRTYQTYSGQQTYQEPVLNTKTTSILIGVGKTETKTKQKTGIGSGVSSFTGVSQILIPTQTQVYNQTTRQQQRQIFIPAYIPPRQIYRTSNKPWTFIKPSFSWAYPTRSGKTKGSKRKYASSVAAFELGWTLPKGYNKKQTFTGMEIRPLEYSKKEVFDKNYHNKINKILVGGY